MLRLPISVLVSTLLLVSTEIVIDGFVTITHAQQAKQAAIRLASGDHKEGYESPQYQTDSLSLEVRSGVEANLFAIVNTAQFGLPKKAEGRFLEPSEPAIKLGRKLFFDRRLSRNKTMSCAMCHIPEQGFTNNELQRPIGFEGRAIKRNAPTILNVVYYQRLFADARENRLEQQVWGPLLASNEMNNPSVGQVIDTLAQLPEYPKLFEDAFGEMPNMLNVGQALAQYQQALLAGNSRFDQWRYGRQQDVLNAEEKEGFALFAGKAQCSSCHIVGDEYALFTDQALHDTGVGYQLSMRPETTTISVQLAPGVVGQLDKSVVDSVGEDKPNDVGRYEVTLDPADRWKYRTASLRNIALTAPYMHNGTFASLESVVRFYNAGGVPHDGQSALIRPLGLSADEQAALVAFMRTLTGSNVGELVADAFAAPIGDTSSTSR